MSEADIELSYEGFLRARKLYWKQEAKNLGKDVTLPDFEKVELGPDDSNFILSSPGPRGIWAVFEDDMATGWFYVYDAVQKKILRCTNIYDRSNVAVDANEVDVGWSMDESACALAVFGQFRAFLGATNDLHIRKPIREAGEDGIYAKDWPQGFEHHLEKEID